MAVRLDKPWRDRHDLVGVHGNLGVFQLADVDAQIIFIGFAGGNSRFGLKGEIRDALAARTDAAFYRLEVNTAYQSRYRELLMAFIADHGAWPRYNEAFPIGRLSPN